MGKLVYEVLEHDGGWAYRVDGAFSETFPSHSDALQAATIAATTHQQRAVNDYATLESLGITTKEPLNLEVLDCGRSRHRFSLTSRA